MKVMEKLRKLDQKEVQVREVVSEVFSFDPEKKFYREQIWLTAMPDSLRPLASDFLYKVATHLMPFPTTLRELSDTDYPYIMFETEEAGSTFEFQGLPPDKPDFAICKKFGSNVSCYIPLDTRIKRLF